MIDAIFYWLTFAVLPPLTYIMVKLATYAFFKARHQFYQDYPPNMKEPKDAV